MKRDNKYRNTKLNTSFGSESQKFEINNPCDMTTYKLPFLFPDKDSVKIYAVGGSDKPLEWYVDGNFLKIKTPLWAVNPQKIKGTVKLKTIV